MKTPLDALSMVMMCMDAAVKQGKDMYSASGKKLGEFMVDVLRQGSKMGLVPKGHMLAIETCVDKLGAQIIGNQIIGQVITKTTGAEEVTNLHDILAGRIPGMKALGAEIGDAIVQRREPNNNEEILAQFIGDFGAFILGDKIMTALNDEEAVGGQIISITVGLLSIEILRRLGKNVGIRITPYVSPYLTTEVVRPQTQTESQAKNAGKAASFLLCAYGITISPLAPVVPPLVAGGLGYKLLSPLAANAAVLATRATGTLYSYCYSLALGAKEKLNQLFIDQKRTPEKNGSYAKILVFRNQAAAQQHLLGHGVSHRNSMNIM